MDKYLTINNSSFSEIVEKKSRFIAYIKNVKSEKEANEFINEIKSKNHDARHNVFAYTLKDGTKRYSDDGEPQGTAGVPILDLLQSKNLLDVCIVVTRYFGGILLGTGGLVRAYTQAAKDVIAKSVIDEMVLCTVFEIHCSYNQYNKLPSIILKYNGIIDKALFNDDVIVICNVPSLYNEKFLKELTNFYSGNIKIQETDKNYKKIKGNS